MGMKTFPILNYGFIHLNASVAIFLFPLMFTINDIITEVYGKERTKSVIKSSLLVLVVLILFSFLAVNLRPSTRFVNSEPAYDLIFKSSIRISIASLLAFALAEMMDLLIFIKLREKLGKKGLWFRNNISNFVAQFFDTAIFMVLAFYAFDKTTPENFIFLAGLIFPYWMLKNLMSVIETPFVYLGVKWLKKEI
jgi:uncharacterized integral membrane protein (TIGR00697 family)